MGRERIGHVDVKSGALFICDFGLLGAFGDEPKRAREAVEAALAKKATEVEHEGVEAVLVDGIAPGRYDVWSEPLDDEEGMRRAVTIDFSPAGASATSVTSARTIELGSVPVDMARLGVLDVRAIEHWNESEPADGRADVVFWGLHEEEVAKRVEAPKLDDDTYGFVDLAVRDAVVIGQRLEALREGGELRFAFDFRPHTHPFFLLAQIRESEGEAGVIEVGGHAVCGFMTTWGDGVFPVTLDVDGENKPIRVTITLATDEAIENMRAVNEDADEDEDDGEGEASEEDADDDATDEDDADDDEEEGGGGTLLQ
jgi:hypothetical protein